MRRNAAVRRKPGQSEEKKAPTENIPEIILPTEEEINVEEMFPMVSKPEKQQTELPKEIKKLGKPSSTDLKPDDAVVKQKENFPDKSSKLAIKDEDAKKESKYSPNLFAKFSPWKQKKEEGNQDPSLQELEQQILDEDDFVENPVNRIHRNAPIRRQGLAKPKTPTKIEEPPIVLDKDKTFSLKNMASMFSPKKAEIKEVPVEVVVPETHKLSFVNEPLTQNEINNLLSKVSMEQKQEQPKIIEANKPKENDKSISEISNLSNQPKGLKRSPAMHKRIPEKNKEKNISIQDAKKVEAALNPFEIEDESNKVAVNNSSEDNPEEIMKKVASKCLEASKEQKVESSNPFNLEMNSNPFEDQTDAMLPMTRCECCKRGTKTKYQNPAWERFWWWIVILFGLFISIFLIISLWKSRFNKSIVVGLAKTTTPVWQIPFPAITVCPIGSVKQSAFNYSDFCDRISRDENELALYDILSTTCRNECLYRSTKFTNMSMLNKLAEISMTVDDVMYRCSWNDFSVCENIFTPIFTDHGLCYTANMLKHEDMFTDVVAKDIAWNFTNQKHPNSRNKDSKYPVNASLHSSFDITLTSNDEDVNYLCTGTTTKFKVFVHPPNALPTPFQNYFWASLNSETHVVIKPQIMTASQDLRSHDPKWRQCYFWDEKCLKFFKEYNQENCEIECLANEMLAKCGCIKFSMPRNIDTPLCAIGSVKCTQQILDKVEEITKKCDCLPSCSSVIYDTEISRINLKNNVDLNETDSFQIDSKSAVFSVYFTQTRFTASERYESYNGIDFLADCGGILALFLGFLVIVLVKAFHLFTSSDMCDLKKLKLRRPPKLQDDVFTIS